MTKTAKTREISLDDRFSGELLFRTETFNKLDSVGLLLNRVSTFSVEDRLSRPIGKEQKLTLRLYAHTDQPHIEPFQSEMTPLSSQTEQDQEMAPCSSTKAMISPWHGLRRGRLRHLTPVASVSFFRVVTAFIIRPKYLARLNACLGTSATRLPSSFKKCRISVIQVLPMSISVVLHAR